MQLTRASFSLSLNFILEKVERVVVSDGVIVTAGVYAVVVVMQRYVYRKREGCSCCGGERGMLMLVRVCGGERVWW